jgi:hypothetical protein
MKEVKEYIKFFNNHSEYDAFLKSEEYEEPNISLCDAEGDVHYNQPNRPRFVNAIFSAKNTTSTVRLINPNHASNIASIEVDGVLLPEGTTEIVFDTVGEHTVIYQLVDPTNIETETFNECFNMKEATVPSSVKVIGTRAFRACSGMTNISLPDGLTNINANAFERCFSLKEVVVPNSVIALGSNNGLNNWGEVFWTCSAMTSVTLSSNLTEIKNATLFNCKSLTELDIPEGVTGIGSRGVAQCDNIERISLPESLTFIDEYAFAYAYKLKSLDIPSGVTNIGYECCYSCNTLNSITVRATTPPTLGGSAFSNTNNCPIYVPAESVEAYKTSWSTYASRIQAIPTNEGGSSGEHSAWDAAVKE